MLNLSKLKAAYVALDVSGLVMRTFNVLPAAYKRVQSASLTIVECLLEIRCFIQRIQLLSRSRMLFGVMHASKVGVRSRVASIVSQIESSLYALFVDPREGVDKILLGAIFVRDDKRAVARASPCQLYLLFLHIPFVFTTRINHF